MRGSMAVYLRGGGAFVTRIDDDNQTPSALGSRMTDGGCAIFTDVRWGKERVIIVNLADVTCLVYHPDEVVALDG